MSKKTIKQKTTKKTPYTLVPIEREAAKRLSGQAKAHGKFLWKHATEIVEKGMN